MTFVLNVLHESYSLLAADREANTEGPTTVTIGNMTIHAEKGVKIVGFRKMKISKCGAVAVGISGSVREHGYFDHFENVEGIDCTIKAILDSVEHFFLSPNCDETLSKPTMMENQGIATFFDVAASRHFSLLYVYTHAQTSSRWFGVTRNSARLVHVGTGSSEFERAVGLEEINRFIASIKSNPDPGACIEWIKGAFGNVSLVAKGVGKDPEFLVSTRVEPSFKVVA